MVLVPRPASSPKQLLGKRGTVPAHSSGPPGASFMFREAYSIEIELNPFEYSVLTIEISYLVHTSGS